MKTDLLPATAASSDDHDVKVQVFPYDKEGDESSYLVNDTIKAGMSEPLSRYSKERENETDRQILETLQGMSAGSSYTDAGTGNHAVLRYECAGY